MVQVHAQAEHVRELLDVFVAEGVDAALVCTFVMHGYTYRDLWDVFRRGVIGLLFGVHTYRFLIYLQPDQGRLPDIQFDEGSS